MASPSFAWIVRPDGTRLWARGAVGQSAVCRLVAGVYDRYAFESWRLLRLPIATTARRRDADAALVKVAAKRCRFEAPLPALAEGDVDVTPSSLQDAGADRSAALGGIGATLTEAVALAACRRLAASVPLEPERFASPRPIAALVLDREGRLLGAAVNNNAVNRLRHAEFNLVANGFATRRIPTGATVYTSLSPCRMCAALLADVAEDGASLRVVSLSLDAGRLGRQTSLAVTLA